jgi:hypothetical protein
MPSNNRRLHILAAALADSSYSSSWPSFPTGCTYVRTSRNGEDGLRNYCLKEPAHTLELMSRFSNVSDLAFFVKTFQNV